MMGALSLVLNILFLQETYPPVILVNKATELRRRTKNWGIHAKQEEIEIDLKELVEKNFTRPLRMLITEPIVLLLSVYMAFIYGLLYLFLTAYPLVFQGVHGMNGGVGGLPFFGMITGELLAVTAHASPLSYSMLISSRAYSSPSANQATTGNSPLTAACPSLNGGSPKSS
jgi:DHA1 family multidrug resistance protein-like MFS transporter